nr:Ig-like domain-containing protein [uncultured Blautia sp.]
MKRKKLALVLSLMMLATSVPAGVLTASAEEMQEEFVASEDTAAEDTFAEEGETDYSTTEEAEAGNSEMSDGFVSVENAEEGNGQVWTDEAEETAEIAETDPVEAENQASSDLTVEENKIMYISEGTFAELKVDASCGDAYKPLSYQWYIEDFGGEDMMEGETESVLKLNYYSDYPIPYRCEVTDAVGNCKKVRVYVCPEKYKEVFAPDFAHAKNFVLGKENQIYANESMGGYFKFVPDQTGNWKLSIPAQLDRPELLVYNSSKKGIKDADVSGKGSVSLDVKLQKGETYYIKCYNMESGATTVTLKAEYENACEHSFGEYTVTKAPTVLAAGLKSRTCKLCGKTETAMVERLRTTTRVVADKIPLQVNKSIELTKLVTKLENGEYIKTAECLSSKPDVAVISGGKVVAKKVGSTLITLSLGSGVNEEITINVQKKAVTATAITIPSTLKLTVGQKSTLAPVISPVTSTDKVSYKSSNTKIASVSKKGVVTAKKSGKAKITIKAGKKTKTIKVTVAKKAPTGIKGVPASKTLKKGKSFTIKAKINPSGAEAAIKYTSSNKKIATVTSKGKVTAKKPGKVTITVKAGKVTKKCVVTVKK